MKEHVISLVICRHTYMQYGCVFLVTCYFCSISTGHMIKLTLLYSHMILREIILFKVSFISTQPLANSHTCMPVFLFYHKCETVIAPMFGFP